jgi:hypothetical protein
MADEDTLTENNFPTAEAFLPSYVDRMIDDTIGYMEEEDFDAEEEIDALRDGINDRLSIINKRFDMLIQWLNQHLKIIFIMLLLIIIIWYMNPEQSSKITINIR